MRKPEGPRKKPLPRAALSAEAAALLQALSETRPMLLGGSQPFRAIHRGGGIARLLHPAFSPWMEISEAALEELRFAGYLMPARGEGPTSFYVRVGQVGITVDSIPEQRTQSQDRSGVFISVAEHQKSALARPFRQLLRPAITGYIVSDEPLIDDAYDPDSKVDAYLERSGAAVVFATADLASGPDLYTRPNISEEIGRIRSKPWLRNRVVVLRQRGVKLPSNTNPAYEVLDPDHPAPAFLTAIRQLRAWSFPIEEEPEGSVSQHDEMGTDAASDLGDGSQRELADLASARVPDDRRTTDGPSLVLVVAAGPRRSLLRPHRLEDPELARQLELEAIYGADPILERGLATTTQMKATG